MEKELEELRQAVRSNEVVIAIRVGNVNDGQFYHSMVKVGSNVKKNDLSPTVRALMRYTNYLRLKRYK